MNFQDHAMRAWVSATDNKLAEAIRSYKLADSMMASTTDEKGPQLNYSLSILRHIVGRGVGRVVPITATENLVCSFTIGGKALEAWESSDAGGMELLNINTTLSNNIRDFMDGLDLEHHPQNIMEHKPHIMVMSAGRCGTVSLYRLLKGSNLIPYHTYWFNLPTGARQNMACQFASGDFRDTQVPSMWLACRAGEWLSGRMIGLNHLDTIFAPAFAAMHPKSKFIYMTRDHTDVFKSFWTKNQWNNQQLMPVYYKFIPEFRWRRTLHKLPQMIAWYLQFTEAFSQAFGRVLGDRYIEISAEKLFARDKREIKRLLDFIESDITVAKAAKHYRKKINEKKHKAVIPLEPGLTEFLQAI